ncbi:MAG: type IV secretion system protein [Aeromonadales bacterium]|nr:type IV secretion system protein [Aeromonadales bacterium]MDY2891651.1 type IV secretion system protein [Succinivibrio sp.]
MKGRGSSVKSLDISRAQIVRALIPMAFGLAGCAFGLISLCAYIGLASQTRIVPYVVTVDRTGAVLWRDDLKGSPKIPEAAVASDIASFIADLRTVTDDQNLRAQAVRRVYARLSEGTQALEAVERHYRKEQDAAIEQSAVSIENILRVSEDTFQIDWSERPEEGPGALMRARVSYTLSPPDGMSLDALKLNPLGVRVAALSMSQRAAPKGGNEEAS